MMDRKELLRPSDLAPLLGVSSSRIYQLIAAGVLPSVRVAGSIRIPRESWDRWLAEQTDRALQAVKLPEPAPES